MVLVAIIVVRSLAALTVWVKESDWQICAGKIDVEKFRATLAGHEQHRVNRI
jgi:hypothetical protein